MITTTVNHAVSLDRAPNLVNATAVPAAKFGTYVQAERTAAVIYLFKPSAANLQAYQAAIAATDKAKPAFTAAMTSEATVKTETADAAKIIHGIVTGMNQLPTLRKAVEGGPSPRSTRSASTARASGSRSSCSWSRPRAWWSTTSRARPSG